jgi:hypothetical protein
MKAAFRQMSILHTPWEEQIIIYMYTNSVSNISVSWHVSVDNNLQNEDAESSLH